MNILTDASLYLPLNKTFSWVYTQECYVQA